MFETLPDSERIARAKTKMDKVLGHFINLAALHENNAIVVFSPTLASQISRSYAANAFNLFQHVMHDFELVRLCALWDRAGPDRVSIPTVVELIDHPRIIDGLADEERAHHASRESHNLNPSPDPELNALEEEAIRALQNQFAERQALRVRTELPEAIAAAKAILGSPRLKALRNHRDKHLAHSLSSTRLEKIGPPPPPVKYGYAGELFEASIPIVEKLHCWVTGKGFEIAQSRKISRRCAEALWNGCTFTVER
jgi:AbiU2